MRHAGDIEPEPIIAVSVKRRAVTGRRPARQRKQRVRVLLRRSRRSQEMRADGSRIGKAKTFAKTFVETCCIDGGETKPALLAADKGERLIIR
jgi:hypothetical protein